jgi:F-type H+-transporting ATPase subunit delta
MLRGASADALAALTDTVGSVRTLGDAEELGDQLFLLAVLLRSDPALRRIATDASLPAEVKQGVVRDLFAGKIGDRAIDLMADAVARRWTSQRDLAAALERLSEIAIVRSAGAKADQLADELFAVTQTLTANPDLRDALGNPGRTVDDRVQLVEKIFGGKFLPSTVTLTKHALAGTYRTVEAALEVYREVAAETAGERVATIRVSEPLKDADRTRLRDALAKQYGRDIHLNEVVDRSVLGGIRIELGDDIIDGTISSRLDDARRRLVG